MHHSFFSILIQGLGTSQVTLGHAHRIDSAFFFLGNSLNNRPLCTLSLNCRYHLLYNLGVQMLHDGRPLVAFDCLIESVQVYQSNPRLWLRLAECCIMAHQMVRDIALYCNLVPQLARECTTFCLHDIWPARPFACTTSCLHDILPARHLACTTFCLHDLLPARPFACTTFCLHDFLPRFEIIRVPRTFGYSLYNL